MLTKFKAGKIGVQRDLTKGFAGLAETGIRAAQSDVALVSDERMFGAELGVLVRIPTG